MRDTGVEVKSFTKYKRNGDDLMVKLNTIYNEDCEVGMGSLEDNSIDMVITSPPYDNLRDYNGYQLDLDGIIAHLYRTLKEGGVVVWVVGDATVNGSETGTSFKQALSFMEQGFRLHDTMFYYKNNPMPQTGKRYHQHVEYMFVFSKGTPKTFNPIMEPTKYKGNARMKNRGKDGSLEYRTVTRTNTKKVGNVFKYNVGGGHSSKDKKSHRHPAIFPHKLAEDQIKTWSNERDVVLDPFMGSGTTAIASLGINRRFIGYEISEEYQKLAEERIKEFV